MCLLGAAGWFLSGLSACSPAFPVLRTEIVNDEIQLPLSSLNGSNLQLIRPKGWYYDIAVQKKEDASYEAILLKCTHQDNQLTAQAKAIPATCTAASSRQGRPRDQGAGRKTTKTIQDLGHPGEINYSYSIINQFENVL